MSHSETTVRLSDLADGDIGDCFAVPVATDRAKTRDGKPYFRTTFRDAARSATAMIWADSTWFADCENTWQTGEFYKLRCRFSESQYGPQIDIDRIRPVEAGDENDGFDPSDFYPATRFDIDEMYVELLEIVEQHITDAPLQQLVLAILTAHEDDVKRMPAATRNHHAFIGGYLEHVLSVTKTATFLAQKYADYYDRMQPPLSQSLVVAGAILHDVGKFRELTFRPQGAEYSAQGKLVGHILAGRDIVREFAVEIPELDSETQLRLEHVIISHQNLPEWGSPIAPHTPEALLVHYADDIDAKFHMMATSLEEEGEEDAEFTSRHNPMRRAIFRGLRDEE